MDGDGRRWACADKDGSIRCACSRHHSQRLELEVAARCRGRRGEAFAQLRRRWECWDGGGDSELAGGCGRGEKSRAETKGGMRRRNGSGLLLLGFHARDKVEGEAVHEVGGVEAVWWRRFSGQWSGGTEQEECGVCEFCCEDPYIGVEGSFHRLN
jgi:hypothetical protein